MENNKNGLRLWTILEGLESCYRRQWRRRATRLKNVVEHLVVVGSGAEASRVANVIKEEVINFVIGQMYLAHKQDPYRLQGLSSKGGGGCPRSNCYQSLN